jgi:hypothetical protein
LFFDGFYQHAKDIYDAVAKEPLFYANFLLTDKTAARKEWNQVFSCSAGPGINDSEELERSTLIK